MIFDSLDRENGLHESNTQIVITKINYLFQFFFFF